VANDSTTSTPLLPATNPALVAVWSVSVTSAAMTATTPGASSWGCMRVWAGSKGRVFCSGTVSSLGRVCLSVAVLVFGKPRIVRPGHSSAVLALLRSLIA
jgi:hypothetical protein